MLAPRNRASKVSESTIQWNGQGTAVSTNELPPTGTTQWDIRVVSNPGASWVCFGIMEPRFLSERGDGDWMPSYTFCTCCDGYPKGRPRWNGKATGNALAGDVFTVTADISGNSITIVGPRGINMQRALPTANYVLYFTVSNPGVTLVLENAVHFNNSGSSNNNNSIKI